MPCQGARRVRDPQRAQAGVPPLSLRAGCGRPGGARRPGEGRPHGEREPPRAADARKRGQAPGAQGAGGRGTGDGSRGGEGGSRPPARCALTWARAAFRGRGLPAGASLLLALPLASAFFALRHLAREVHARRRRLRRRRRATSLVRGLGSGLGKVCPSRGRASGPAAAVAPRGGVSCRLRGAARTRRAVRATWDWRSLRQAIALALGLLLSLREVLGSRCCRLLSWPLSGALAARRRRGDHSPARTPIARQPPPPLRSCPPREPGVPTSFGELLAGSFSIAPQPPPPARRLSLAPPSHPPLASPPPASPPHPHPEAWTRHREEPGLGAPGRSPFPSPSPAGRGAVRAAERLPGTPDRGRWKLRGDAAAATATAGREPSGQGRFKDPGVDPGTLLLPCLRSQAAPPKTWSLLFDAGKCWRKKFATLTPARQIKALEPGKRRGTFAVFPLEFRVHSFLSLVKTAPPPPACRAMINSGWKGI